MGQVRYNGLPVGQVLSRTGLGLGVGLGWGWGGGGSTGAREAREHGLGWGVPRRRAKFDVGQGWKGTIERAMRFSCIGLGLTAWWL